MVGGLLDFLRLTPMEKFAAEFGPGSPNYSPETLEATWRSKAEEARTGRLVAGTVILAVGVAGLGVGAAVVAGAGDLDREERSEWVVASLVGGAAFVTAGALAWTMESPIERQFALAYPGAAAPVRVDVSFVPTRGGGQLQLTGSF